MNLDKIKIEVPADEPWQNDKRMWFQRIWIHGVDKYPTKASRRLENPQDALREGVYRPRSFVLDYGNIMVDYNDLEPVK